MPNAYEVEYTVHTTYTARVEAKSEKEAIQKVREYETFDVTETDCDGPYSISVALVGSILAKDSMVKPVDWVEE